MYVLSVLLIYFVCLHGMLFHFVGFAIFVAPDTMAACCCINNLILLENPGSCSFYTIFSYYMSDSPCKSRILMTRTIPTMAMTMKTKCGTHQLITTHHYSSQLCAEIVPPLVCSADREMEAAVAVVVLLNIGNSQMVKISKKKTLIESVSMPPFSMELCSSAQPSWQLLRRYRPSATGKSCSLNVSSQNGPWKSTRQLDTTKHNC